MDKCISQFREVTNVNGNEYLLLAYPNIRNVKIKIENIANFISKVLTEGDSSFVSDVPTDGILYGRKDKKWEQITFPDVTIYLKKDDAKLLYQPIGNYLTEIPEEYVTETELINKEYAPKEYVDSNVNTINDTIRIVNDKISDLTNTKADKTEIPSLDGYATEDWVEGKLYLTEHLDISGKLDVSIYNADKETFALKVELPDVSNFITKSVSDLENYYRKNETYTQTLVKDLINSITTINFEVVDNLPELDQKENIIYLVPSSKTEELNVKDEYIWINNNWELIGSTKIDLSGYALKDEIPTKISQLTNDSGYITTIPDDYITNTELENKGYATITLLNDKLDIVTYNTDKETFALKSDIPDVSGFITSTIADATYQPIGDYITEIKTINGQSLVGSGNIEIQGGGGGISDAPSDGNKYVRQDGNWVEETTVDTSNFATKAELEGKVDGSEIADMATKTWVGEQGFLTSHQDISQLATKQEVTEGLATKQDKGNYATKSELANKADKTEIPTNISELINDSGYITSIPSEYITETELTGMGYATTTDLGNYVTTSTANSTFATKTELGSKQETLISGTNIKTVNGTSLLGSGNITIESLGGSVDITDIIVRLNELTEVGGTCTEEDYSALKGYADSGIVTYINEEGSSMIVQIKNLGGVIQVLYEVDDIQLVGVVMCIIDTSKKVSLVNNIFYTIDNYGSGLLGSYSKPSSYSAITKDDAIATAIGKLEAGIGSGIEDAPSDGNVYARQNGEWVTIQSIEDVIEIDQTISDPATMISGSVNGSVIQYIRKNSHRVLAKKTGEGTVTYIELDDVDSNKYAADGSAAALDGTEGDVFVKLPTFYYKGTEGDNVKLYFALSKLDEEYIEWDTNILIGTYEAYYGDSKLQSCSGVVSSGSISQDEFKSYAAARGDGYQLVDWQMHCVLGCLFYAMYGNTNSQAICGEGTISYKKICGETNSLGMNDTKAKTNGNEMSINFWGLENWWGNKLEWMQEDNIGTTMSTYDPVTKGTRTIDVPNYTGYLVKRMVFGKYMDLIPMSDDPKSGSISIGYCDYQHWNSSFTSRVVGRSNSHSRTTGGVSYASANSDSSYSLTNFGSRLAFRGVAIKAKSVAEFKTLPIL